MSQPFNNPLPRSDERALRMEARASELEEYYLAETSRVEATIAAARKDHETAARSTAIDSTADTAEPATRTHLKPGQAKFYASDQCKLATSALQELVDSPDHETDSSYYNDDLDFCARHLDYLSRHPHTKLDGYLSNLKLMTRKQRG